MEYYYAKVDKNGFCTDIITSYIEECAENMIPISSHDTSLIWKKYENAEFVEAEMPEIEQEEDTTLTENEIIMLALADLYGEVQSLKEGVR